MKTELASDVSETVSISTDRWDRMLRSDVIPMGNKGTIPKAVTALQACQSHPDICSQRRTLRKCSKKILPPVHMSCTWSFLRPRISRLIVQWSVHIALTLRSPSGYYMYHFALTY
jgi:hypothetical protein